MLECAHKPKPPSRAALASWVELLNSQAGGGHNYEDVGSIFVRKVVANNTRKQLRLRYTCNASSTESCEEPVTRITRYWSVSHCSLGL